MEIKSLDNLPVDILINIIKHTNVPTISKMNCINRNFNQIIDNYLWELVDNLITHTDTVLIPKTIETFKKYRYLVDWSNIILYNQNANKTIPEYVIKWIPDKIDLDMICVYQTFSDDLIRHIYPKVSKSSLLSKQVLPLDILYSIVDSENDLGQLLVTDWFNIWQFQKIDIDFIKRYINNIDWYNLSFNKNVISYDFIWEFGDNIIWEEFTKHGIHENILVHFIHKFSYISWINICRYTELSDDFIVKYLVYLDISSILRYQKISETLLQTIISSFDDFDIEFHFQSIGIYQKLSKNFIKQYKQHLPFRVIIRNKNIKKSIIHEIYSNELEYYILKNKTILN
jgi:hypothetical protein